MQQRLIQYDDATAAAQIHTTAMVQLLAVTRQHRFISATSLQVLPSVSSSLVVAVFSSRSGSTIEGSFHSFDLEKMVANEGSLCLWAALHPSLSTNKMLQHKGIQLNSYLCILCYSIFEDPDRFFLRREYSWQTWG